MRAFTAVDVSGRLADELLRVREAVDLGFSPVRKNQFHLTLQFFEDVNEEEIEQISHAARKVETGGFQAEVEGLGSFPSKEHIRVVWAGVSGSRIFELKEQVSCHEVEEDNEHDFHPHITLLRVNGIQPETKRKLQRSLEEFKNHDFGNLEVNSVKLYESSNGRHRAIEEIEL